MTSKLKAALKMSTLSPDGKVTTGQNIINCITVATNYFPPADLPIPMASMTACVDNLHNAILAAAGGSPGSISFMREKERVLLSMFNVLRAYVEMVSNGTSDPKTVIEAAGMTASTTGGNYGISELTIVAMGNGVLQISVPRQSGESAFVYYYSTDGNSWQEFECSKLATVQLKNQTPASTLYFKYAPIGKTKGGFSQPKSAIVL